MPLSCIENKVVCLRQTEDGCEWKSVSKCRFETHLEYAERMLLIKKGKEGK